MGASVNIVVSKKKMGGLSIWGELSLSIWGCVTSSTLFRTKQVSTTTETALIKLATHQAHNSILLPQIA